MLAKGCIILMILWIIMSSIILKLFISFNEWNSPILGMLILEHKIVVVTILAIEIILIGKVP